MPKVSLNLVEQCSIARAANLIGDAWTVMIIRELFWGSSRFEALAGNCGMASNILSSRLRKLVQNGIVSKTVVAEDARRFDYALTPKGEDLFPLLMAVMAWGDRWSPGEKGPLVELRHRVCGKRTRAGLTCSACAGPLLAADLSTRFAGAYRVPEGRQRLGPLGVQCHRRAITRTSAR
jgi:DNA-binding HxlR family transcriptional regulator